MAVRTQEHSVQLLEMIVQVRYVRGYRYLDSGGKLLDYIINSSDWVMAGLVPQQATMRHLSLPLNASIGVQFLSLDAKGRRPIPEAEKLTRDLGDQAEFLYSAICDKSDLGDTSRVGLRFQFFAPADSLEEGDRMVVRQLKSPYAEQLSKELKMDLVDGGLHHVFEDPGTGIRRSVHTVSLIRDDKVAKQPALGFADDAKFDGGLLFDIDTYSRPEGGKFSKLSMHIQTEFLHSKRVALESLRWIVSQKGG